MGGSMDRNMRGNVGKVATLALLAVAGILSLAAPAQARNASRTALVQYRASTYEALDDFYLAFAIALNKSDIFERLDCLSEAIDELQDARELAREQLAARLALLAELGNGPYDPDLDPENFQDESGDPHEVDNPFFPLTPGTEKVLEGEDEVIFETVLSDTREIAGVECTTVECIVEEDGEVVEVTHDYYAQHDDGTVWYFGELSFELEDGFIVNMAGSFISGVDGAKAGIIMLADPAANVGLTYRQEWAPNEAEDIGTVDGADVDGVETDFDTFDDCVRIKDTSPIEPDACEFKLFAPGVGFVKELDENGDTIVELVSLTTP